MTEPPGSDHAARLVRAELPPLPPDVDRRVLAALRDEVGRPLQIRRRRRFSVTGGRVRAALARPRLALVCAAVLAAIAVWGPSLGPLTHTDTAAAVTIGPLPADCLPRGGADANRLEVAGVWGGAEARRFARVLQRFERETAIKVAYRYETRNIAPKLRARVARGCPPDVALLPQPGLMTELARAGALQPLGRVTTRLVRTGYARDWRKLGSVGGRLYGVWFKASNKSMLWYRPQALLAAGIDRPPATWEALLHDARRLAAAGFRPLSIAGADGWTLTDWFENVYLRSAGARRYDQLARHQIAWTHPSVQRALALLGRLLGDPALVGRTSDLLRTTFEQSVRQALDRVGPAAMVFEGDFVRAFVGADAPGFTDFPAIGATTPDQLVVGGDVAVRFSRSLAARRLIRFLATPRAAAAWASRGGFISPNRGVPASAYPDALTRRAAAALVGARSVRFDLSDLQPPAFGATAGQGMWWLFQELAARPRASREIARRLEAGAIAADGGAGPGQRRDVWRSP